MEQEKDQEIREAIKEDAGIAPLEKEKRRTYPKFWMVAVGVFLASFFITSAILFLNKEKEPGLETEQKIAEKIIQQRDNVLEKIFYKKCQHLVTQVQENQIYTGLGVVDLEKQGWQVTAKDDHTWWLYREEDALCPEDIEKRSIRKNGGQLGVYTGPVGAQGDLLFSLEYREEMLPENWQRQIETGGIDFADENILFSALESLDEYLEY